MALTWAAVALSGLLCAYIDPKGMLAAAPQLCWSQGLQAGVVKRRTAYGLARCSWVRCRCYCLLMLQPTSGAAIALRIGRTVHYLLGNCSPQGTLSRFFAASE